MWTPPWASALTMTFFSTGVDLLDCQALYSTSSPLGTKPKSAEHIQPQICQNTQAAEVYQATTPQSFNPQISILQLLKVTGGLMFARQSHSFSGLSSHAVYFEHRWRPLSSIHMPTHHQDYRLLGPILGSPYSWKLPALTQLIATTTVLRRQFCQQYLSTRTDVRTQTRRFICSVAFKRDSTPGSFFST